MDILSTLYQMNWNQLYIKRKNELPYWKTDDGEIYFSKLSALQQRKNITFHFCEDKFTTNDNSKDLDADVYVKRLQQLRNKYSYLRLMCGGGSDSKLIIDTAIKHGIYIDEILILTTCQNSIAEQAEIFRAQQQAKLYKLNHPRTKVNQLRLTLQDWLEYHSSYDMLISHDGYTEYNDRPKSHSFLYKHSTIKDHMLLPHKKNLSHCDIVGNLAPSVLIFKGKPYWYVIDEFIGHHISPFIEYFYTSADMPDVHLYQCRKYYEKMQELNLVNSDNVLPEVLLQLKINTGRRINKDYEQDFANNTHNKNEKDLLHYNNEELWKCVFENAKQFIANRKKLKMQIYNTAITTTGIFSKLISLYDNEHIDMNNDIFVETFKQTKGKIKNNSEYERVWSKYITKKI